MRLFLLFVKAFFKRLNSFKPPCSLPKPYRSPCSLRSQSFEFFAATIECSVSFLPTMCLVGNSVVSPLMSSTTARFAAILASLRAFRFSLNCSRCSWILAVTALNRSQQGLFVLLVQGQFLGRPCAFCNALITRRTHRLLPLPQVR